LIQTRAQTRNASTNLAQRARTSNSRFSTTVSLFDPNLNLPEQRPLPSMLMGQAEQSDRESIAYHVGVWV
jgi:hypothetical protein